MTSATLKGPVEMTLPQIVAEPDDDEEAQMAADLALVTGDAPPAPPAAPPAPTPAPPASVAPAAAPAIPAAPTPEQVADLQAQIEKLTGSVRRNNRELQARREVQRFMEQHGITDWPAWLAENGIDPATGRRQETDPETDRQQRVELERRIAQLEQEHGEGSQKLTKYETALRDASLKAALRAARFTGTFEKATRVMDLSKITVALNGDEVEIAGIEDAVKGLQAEIPEWFRPPAAQPSTPPRRSVDAGDRRPAPPRPLTWDQQAASRLAGGGRR